VGENRTTDEKTQNDTRIKHANHNHVKHSKHRRSNFAFAFAVKKATTGRIPLNLPHAIWAIVRTQF
jgi:hypothetical protein